MTIFAAVLKILSSIAASIFMEAATTPGVEHEIEMEDGGVPIDRDIYDGLYGGDQGEADSGNG